MMDRIEKIWSTARVARERAEKNRKEKVKEELKQIRAAIDEAVMDGKFEITISKLSSEVKEILELPEEGFKVTRFLTGGKECFIIKW